MAVPAVPVPFGATYATLLPAWAVDVLHGDAATNGVFQAARGAGSLLGALIVAALSHQGRRGRWLTTGMVVYPLVLLVFASVRSVPLALTRLIGLSRGGMVLYNMANTLLQTHVPDAVRGRFMSIYSIILFGGMPSGALWAGAVAAPIGAPLTLMVRPLIALGFAVLVWVRAPQLRALV